MKKLSFFFCLLMGLMIVPNLSCAQEKEPEINVEESAEVFLEEYSDDFEEAFFEALKQKGIENYDRAINLFLECKRLDDKNIVVDHELAKAYYSNKNYNDALDFSTTALMAEPENSWYLNTMVDILERQGSSLETLALNGLTDNLKLQENLAVIYYRKGKYEDALAILKKLKKTPFLSNLASKITDSIEKRTKKSQKTTFPTSVKSVSENVSSVEGFKRRIQELMSTSNHTDLMQLAEEALENFPSQPYFYYAQGYAFNQTGKHKDAIEILEASLDYLIDDISLSNKIYKELSDAYNGINNSVKANMYLSKVKPGF